ncbi:calmodulin-binding protein 60 B-like [Dioscorea cayenensis subsp. rotundata]|uniref:Calmodulin-binding protein 60 B-like n=1 Tax=Dioscorea cayennensis subsp. rotundata TaxID=55577 RepID=A0AB40BMG7_DIOCR|nr:calmodulin-binding protein 60 B-like [Dioscorea cayenensis subsp. rotundata]
MNLKRPHVEHDDEEEEENCSLVPGSKRPKIWINAMKEVMGAQCMQRHLSRIEPFLRRVVKEEVNNALCRHVSLISRMPVNRIQGTPARSYRLLFRSKIDILVINGDFGGDGQEEWTEEEFADGIVREREGKRPLLTGDLVVSLNNGTGFLGDLTFTDNSSWIRSRKFRLGAKSRCSEGRVKEAISEAFLVKDHRGELYKKHHPPSLNDEIWRLEKISKDGAFCKRLTDRGIKTVKDFLRYQKMDPDELRNLLGGGMSNRMWDAIVEHASECLQDGKYYSYRNNEHGNGLIFNSVFDIIVKELKLRACRSPNEIVECDEPLAESLPGPPYQDGFLPMYHGFPHQTPAICDVPSQGNDVPIVHYPPMSFPSNSFNIGDFFDVPTVSPDNNGLSIVYNSRECMPMASSTSILHDDNGFIQVNTGGRLGCFSRPHNVGPPIYSGKWNKQMPKLMAALRWMSIGKCAPSRRARFPPLNHDMNELHWLDFRP